MCKDMTMNYAMHRTRHALGFGTMILGMPSTHLPLGESTPPQGVNGLVLPFAYLTYLWGRVVSLVQFVQLC